MSRTQVAGWVGSLLAAAVFGFYWCGGFEPPELTTLGGPTAIRKGSEPLKPLVLTAVDRATFDAEITKHRGQVVLVDCWATWCEPCVEQLPHTFDLGRTLGDRGLTVVTLSCDEPAETERVANFLAEQDGGVATNLISQFGGSPKTMEAFEITSGSVPFYKLYDRKGQLRQAFGTSPVAKKQFTSADIEAAVEQLLAERD